MRNAHPCPWPMPTPLPTQAGVLEVKVATTTLDDAKAARERGVARKAAALHKGMAVKIAHRHHFSSQLGRMSVVAHVRNMRGADGHADDAVLCLVKGSPESIGPLLKEGGEAMGGKPAWFDATYTALAEQVARHMHMHMHMAQAPLATCAGTPRRLLTASPSRLNLASAGPARAGARVQALRRRATGGD